MNLLLGMFVCSHRFNVFLSRKSSHREGKLLEKSKKSKNTVKRSLGLYATLCVCVCVCVCLYT